MERARLPTSSSPSPSTKSTLDQLWRAWPPAAGRFGASAQTILHQGMLSVSCPYVRFSVSYLSRLRYVEWRLPVFFVAYPRERRPEKKSGRQKGQERRAGSRSRASTNEAALARGREAERGRGGAGADSNSLQLASYSNSLQLQTATHCN